MIFLALLTFLPTVIIYTVLGAFAVVGLWVRGRWLFLLLIPAGALLIDYVSNQDEELERRARSHAAPIISARVDRPTEVGCPGFGGHRV